MGRHHFFSHLLLGQKDVSVESTGDFRPCAMHNRFFYETSPFPPQAADSWRWDGMSEMKKTLTRMVTTLSKCGISISKFSRKVVQNILSCEKIQSNVSLLQPEVHQMQPLPLRCTNYHPIPISAMDIPPCKITIPFYLLKHVGNRSDSSIGFFFSTCRLFVHQMVGELENQDLADILSWSRSGSIKLKLV